jgi:hypothetical protein
MAEGGDSRCAILQRRFELSAAKEPGDVIVKAQRAPMVFEFCIQPPIASSI